MKKVLLVSIAIFFANLMFAQTVWTDETMYSGFVGRYEIRMTLAVPYGGGNSCLVIGDYYYTSVRSKMSLCSGVDDNDRIYETANGRRTGYFVLNGAWNKRVGQTISGTWYSLLKHTSYPVVLKVIGKGPY